MKRTFLSALVIAVTSSSLFAQVSFGPKIGGGLSTLKDTKIPAGVTDGTYKSIITPQVGVIVNIQMGKMLALRPELLYLQRGTQGSSSESYSSYGQTYTYSSKSTTRISYIELPVNVALGCKVGPGRLEGFAGPAFALALGGKSKFETDYSGVSTSETFTIKSGKDPQDPNNPSYTNTDGHINPLNISLNFGIDYKFDNGFLIQAGYNLGLSNINPHYSNSNLESHRNDYITKASAFNLAIGYLFGGKK